jgi:ketosteroid isomerase-like protein
MSDQQIREALNQHWAASDAGDFAIEHDIYLEDAVLDSAIPRAQLGRHNIQIARTV